MNMTYDLEQEKKRLLKMIEGVSSYQDTLSKDMNRIRDELGRYSRDYRKGLLTEVTDTSYNFGFRALLRLYNQMANQENCFYDEFKKIGINELTGIFETLYTEVWNCVTRIKNDYGKIPFVPYENWPENQKELFNDLIEFCEHEKKGMDEEYFIARSDDEDPEDTIVDLVKRVQDAVRNAFIKYTVEEILLTLREIK